MAQAKATESTHIAGPFKGGTGLAVGEALGLGDSTLLVTGLCTGEGDEDVVAGFGGFGVGASDELPFSVGISVGIGCSVRTVTGDSVGEL